MVLVPALLILLAPLVPPSHLMLYAIGTSLAAIAFSCLSSAWGHFCRGAVDVRVALRMAPALVAGAVAGSLAAPGAPAGLLLALALVDAALCLVVVRRTFFASAATNAPRRASPFVLASISALAASAGVGIGTLTVSYLRRLEVPAHAASGTAAALGVPVALTAAIGMAATGVARGVDAAHAIGFVHLLALAGIVPGVVLGAQLGARLAHRCVPKVLMAMFCVCSGAAATRSLLVLAA